MDIAGVAADGEVSARRWRSIVPQRRGARSWKPVPLILRAGLPVLCAAALAMPHLDPLLAQFMKAHATGDFARVARAVSDLGVGTGYIVAAVLALAGSWLLKRRALAAHLFGEALERVQRFSLLFLLSLAASGAVVNAVKALAGRHRPRDLFNQSQYGFEPFMFRHGLDSFPSGHSQTIFVVAVVLCLAMPKRWRMFSVAAALVAATRIVMTNHYLSDVLVGSYIGIASVLLLAPFVLKDGKVAAGFRLDLQTA